MSGRARKPVIQQRRKMEVESPRMPLRPQRMLQSPFRKRNSWCTLNTAIVSLAIFVYTLVGFYANAQPAAIVRELPPPPDRWALVVGISNYEDKHLNSLYGQQDATAIASDLKQYAAFPA